VSETAVDYLLDPHVDSTLLYQRYYLIGLARVTHLRIRGGPAALRAVRAVDRRVLALSRLRRARATLRFRRPVFNSGLTGRYVAQIGDRRIRFAIDARDSSPIHDPEVLDWSDLYFKSNRWPDAEYDPRVVPIVNGNGLLDPSRIAALRELRDARRDVDVAFVSRVWGGAEHNVRLFEALARVDGRKELHAIFPKGAAGAETDEHVRRLERIGVRCTRTGVSPDRLWRTLARSRVVLVRAGVHLCIPWRMLDLLCLGACVAVDTPFIPRWPEPLRDGVNFRDCGVERPEDGSAADREAYERVTTTVSTLLEDGPTAARIRAANAHYFDEHAAPDRVAEYIVRRLAEAA